MASKKQTYQKRGGAAGASGHFLEINLLTLFKLQGDKKLKDFYLAGNLEAVGAFDDVVIRYTDDQGGQTVIFLQAKSKENTQKKGSKLTFEKFRKGGELDLHKYFMSFLKIRDQLQKPQEDDPIFQGKYENLECNFVIYTNAVRDSEMKEHVNDKENNPLCILFDENCGDTFQLKDDAAKKLLNGVQNEVEIEKLIKLLKQISKGPNKNVQGDENFIVYHAFLVNTVFSKHESSWKIREGFLEGDVANETLKKFRDAMINWYADEKLGAKKGESSKLGTADITKHMKDWNLKLPDWFGSETLEFDKDDCDTFVQIASKCVYQNICTISQLNKKLKKKLYKVVGKVFVFDEECKMFKLNEEQLVGEPAKVLEYLRENFCNSGLRFDFKLDKFPILSLGFTPIDEEPILHFNGKLTVLTEQPDVKQIEKMIKSASLGNVSKEEAERRYSLVTQKIIEWWMTSGETNYLKKHDGFLDKIMKGIVFNLKGNLNSFIGRREELDKLHSALQNSESNDKTVVISQMASVSGLGGIGKTELARYYAHEYQDSYDGNVIWIDANNYESIAECYRRLCKDSLHISTQDANNKEKEINSIVQDVYNFFHNRRSLFIFDNANHFKNCEDINDGIEPFLSPTRAGTTKPHFIITSRNKKWPRFLLKLDVFNDAEAEQLVKSQLGIKDVEQDEHIKVLIKELQNFPLAMQQAVAYIREKDQMKYDATGLHFTIQDYLALLTNKTKELLSFKFPEDFPDHYTKTTFVTWNITLAEIEKHELGQKAKKIFNIMAFLSPTDIPIQFFMDNVHISADEIIQVVNLLAKYSMINMHEGVADIHRLVQWVARLSLSDFETKDVLKAGLELVDIHTDNKLINHGASLWNYACSDDDLVSEFNYVPSTVIEALRDSLRYEEAYAFGEKSINSLQRVLGNEHMGALNAQTEFALVLNEIGNHTSALIAFQHVFGVHKRNLGADHTLTLNAQYDIAQTLRNQGKFDEALASYKELFEKQMKILGPDNPSTLITQNYMADTLKNQGKHDEALASYMEVLEKEITILGPDNPATISTQHNISVTLKDQGKYNEALASLKEVFEKQFKILGPNNPTTLSTQHNIAVTLQDQGKYDEALVSYKEVLEKQIKTLGPNNPSTFITQNNMAYTLKNLGKYDEALASYKEVFEKQIKILGPNNPSTLITQNCMADTLRNLGKYDEALASYKEVFAKQSKILGPDNPCTLTTQHNIAQTLQNKGKYDEALVSLNEVFEKLVKTLGPNNPSTLTTQHNIAVTLKNLGKCDEALATFKEVLEKQIKILGPDNPSTLATQRNIKTVAKQDISN